VNLRRNHVPAGLPGDQQQTRERRARLRRAAGWWSAALLAWALLTLLIGPSRPNFEPPPLGPAHHDVVATRDFTDDEPALDLQARVGQAVAGVPVRYLLDTQLATRRIDALHDAFRLVRPRYRLFRADHDRQEAPAEPLPSPHPDKGHEPKPRGKPAEVKVESPEELERQFSNEMAKLRPEFEAQIAAAPKELTADTFGALLQAGFSEEIELVLTDIAQVLLSQRIVRDLDRFDDDLGRGVLEVTTGQSYARRSPSRPEVLDLEQALRKADGYVIEFAKQKKPSRLDEPVLQAALRSVARAMVEPTLTRDLAATRKAEEVAVAAVPKTRTVPIAKGQVLVQRGQVVTPLHQARIAHMWQGAEGSTSVRAYVATGLLLGLALLLFVLFARRHLHHFRHRPHDAALLTAILLVHAAVLRAFVGVVPLLVESGLPVPSELILVILPHALGPSLATLFLRPFTAAPFASLCAVVATLMCNNAPHVGDAHEMAALIGVMALIAGLAGVQAARQFRQRSDLMMGTLTISAISAVAALAVGMLGSAGNDIFDSRSGWLALLGASSGISTYLLLAASTPAFESVFNRLTDIKLVELASMNHPALRQLATEAPGTFTHSVMVGNLAQSACDAIGANGLLARVGAYYHDLGKTRAPRYFAENQAGDNPHDRLKPSLSALIIKSHVKDGMKILKEFGLPDEIIDFVPQHHGTSLIAHFFHRAQRDGVDSGEDVAESDFRYPGPKPQRKETALLMLADAVEAAAKALPEPNAMRMQALVKKIVAAKTEDGQFDECDLTLRELAQVESAFVKTLVGIHHARPAYLPALHASRDADEPSRTDLAVAEPTSLPTGVTPVVVFDDDNDNAAEPQAPTALVARAHRTKRG
jgi:putative nucleotidyltransferase with HDIG domain